MRKKAIFLAIMLTISCECAYARPSCFFYEENGKFPNTPMEWKAGTYLSKIGSIVLRAVFNAQGQITLTVFKRDDLHPNEGAIFDGESYIVESVAGGPYNQFVVLSTRTSEGFLTIDCTGAP